MLVNIVATLVVVAILGGAVAYIIKSKKSGVKCIGCPSGGCCPSAKNGGCGCNCQNTDFSQ
jgi:hypothetical protein